MFLYLLPKWDGNVQQGFNSDGKYFRISEQYEGKCHYLKFQWSPPPLPPPQFFFSDTLLFIFFLITWLILHMLDFICHSRLFPFILHHMYLHVDDWNHTSLILCWLKLYRCEINKITKSHDGKQNPVSVWLISFLCAILSFAQDTI